IVVVLVPGSKYQRDRTRVQERAQTVDLRRPVIELLVISPLKFRPPVGLMVEPFAQFGTWSKLLQPVIDSEVRLLDAARPYPVDQDPAPVVAVRRLVSTFQQYPGFCAHLRLRFELRSKA